MKKGISLILVCIMLLTMIGCGNKQTAADTQQSETTLSTDGQNETVPSENSSTEVLHAHTYSTAVTAPTCTEDGYTTYACDCGESYVSDKVAATGHNFGQWETTVEPTETTTGTSQRKCDACGEKETRTLGKKLANHTHSYETKVLETATCMKGGVNQLTCSCGEVYTVATEKASHNYAAATCTAPRTCTVCGITSGSPVHNWNKYNYCNDCGIKNPEPQTGNITFTANIKSEENKPVAGVTVNVYTTSVNQPAGSAVTNNQGTATMTINAHTAYKVVLSHLPEGYEAKESYDFTATTVNISLKVLPVYDPLDHSKAKYQEGDTMADFTLTDTDGNTYTLSQLKNTKKLILLDFWYNTCEPCKAEFPWFEEAIEAYGENIILLAVNPYNDMNSIRDLRVELGATFPMVVDNIKLAEGFSVTSFPTMVFIDSDGKILRIKGGKFASKEALLQMIESYI